MLLILLSLGVHASFAVVLAAFGAALVTSLLNVLLGGGGTIETILAAVLGFPGGRAGRRARRDHLPAAELLAAAAAGGARLCPADAPAVMG